jgi:methylated-DNA-[protein]-cysteine S-methyltransferase
MKTFNQRCYELLRKVPKGKVTTYAELAHALGTRAYRAVGQAMNKNPDVPATPCHRVVNADGRIGGYAYPIEIKINVLKTEGVEVKDGRIVDFKNKLHRFS